MHKCGVSTSQLSIYIFFLLFFHSWVCSVKMLLSPRNGDTVEWDVNWSAGYEKATQVCILGFISHNCADTIYSVAFVLFVDLFCCLHVCGGQRPPSCHPQDCSTLCF